MLLRLPQEGYPFPEIGLRDIELDPETQLGDLHAAGRCPVRARASAASPPRAISPSTPRHVGSARPLQSRRALRPAQGRRSARGDGVDPPVQQRLGRAGPDRRDRAGRHPICQHPGPPGRRPAAVVRRHRRLQHRRGHSRRRRLGASQPVPARGRVADRRHRGHRRAESQHPLPPQQLAPARPRHRCLQLEGGQRDYEAYQGYTVRLHGLVTRESTPIWQKVWTYSYGAEILATNESRIGKAELSLGDAFFIGGLFGQLGYDRSNSLLDPTSGFRLTGRVNPEASLGNGTDFYLRNQIDGSVYYEAGGSFVLAGRTRVGSLFGIPRDALAPSRRFYAGGGGSVRGFGYQELGPRDALNVPLGGRSLAEFAVEGRYRFGNYGAVAFVDAGQVYESQFPGFNDLRFGVGIGGRVYTNFGPVRLDVATPIDRREGESKISVYVSIGQAF